MASIRDEMPVPLFRLEVGWRATFSLSAHFKVKDLEDRRTRRAKDLGMLHWQTQELLDANYKG